MNFNYKVIGNILGILLIINGGFMLMCLGVSLYYNESESIPLAISSAITLLSGFILWKVTYKKTTKDLKKKDGYLIVSLGWIVMSFFGILPYVLSGAIPSFTNAFFETVSGFTTTGASILNDIESVSKGILFWRSLTQWIGGMGIIVLALAILPFLGIGGMQLFVAEAPGITPDKLKPRIQDTAKRLWYLYVGLTLVEAIALYFAGMGGFDAVNHALTTMATGGFSTKNASIAYYDSSLIHYIIIFFMFLAGTSFTLTYMAVIKRNFKKVFKNEEFVVYLIFTIVITLIVTLALMVVQDFGIAISFRDALFQVVSLITTTGYATADYTTWSSFLTVLFFILLFVGGSAGSTAGGVKIIRHVVLFKNSFLELKRQLHPSAVMPVRISGKAIDQTIVYNVLAFIMIYILVFLVGVTLLSSMNVDFDTAFGAVATSLGNVGPGIGEVGPANNFSGMPVGGKWLLSFLMILGRLELFTVLMLLSPYFWRKR